MYNVINAPVTEKKRNAKLSNQKVIFYSKQDLHIQRSDIWTEVYNTLQKTFQDTILKCTMLSIIGFALKLENSYQNKIIYTNKAYIIMKTQKSQTL